MLNPLAFSVEFQPVESSCTCEGCCGAGAGGLCLCGSTSGAGKGEVEQ